MKSRRISVIPTNVKSIPLLLAVILVSGCRSGASYEMNADVARQIAIDAAGVKASNLQNVHSVPDHDDYSVTFTNNKGSYKIIVSGSGEVLSYKFDSTEGSEPQNTEEDNSSAPPQAEAQKPEADAAVDSSKPDKKDNGVYSPVEGGLSSAELISRAASHLGLVSYSDADFRITPDSGQNLRLETIVDGNRPFTVIINGVTGEIYSTLEG